MERREKGELFEQIQREYEFGVGTIKGVGCIAAWCGRRWQSKHRGGPEVAHHRRIGIETRVGQR